MGVSFQFLDADGVALSLGQVYRSIYEWCKAEHPENDDEAVEKDANGWNNVLEWAAIGNKTADEWMQKDTSPEVKSLCQHLRVSIGLVAFTAWR